MSGRLVLVATPIGNLGDLSPRASQELKDVDWWIVEDTRISGKLQTLLGVKKPMRVLNDHTSRLKTESYVDAIREAKSVALLTDGGTPAISDPGALLTDLCLDADVTVDAMPGPSAVMTALALSGFFAQRFAFLGFLPRKPGAIRSELAHYLDSTLTIVLFESPFRVKAVLAIAHEVLGERRVAICRELTKAHQEIVRGTLAPTANLPLFIEKGEFTIVIEGKRRRKSAD